MELLSSNVSQAESYVGILQQYENKTEMHGKAGEPLLNGLT